MKRIPLLALGAALLSACGGQLQLPDFNLPAPGGSRENVTLELRESGFAPVLQVSGLVQPATLGYRIGDHEHAATSAEVALRGFCPGDNTVHAWVRRGQADLARREFALRIPTQGAVSLQAPAEWTVTAEALEIPFSQAADFGCLPALVATAPGVTLGEPQLTTRDGQRLFRLPLALAAGQDEATLQLELVQGGASAVSTVRLTRPAATPPPPVTPPPTPGPVTPAPTVRVRLVGEERVSLRQGMTLRFPVEVTTTGGASPALAYTSGAPAVAAVSADGEIRALSPGEAVLEALAVADPTQRVRLTVTVTPPPSFALNLSAPALTLETGQTRTVMVSLSPHAGYSGAATLTVQTPAGLTVTPSTETLSAGQPVTLTVRGNTAGSFELRVTATDGQASPPLSASAAVAVTVTAPAPPADAPPTIHSVNLSGVTTVERSPQPVEVHATGDRGIAEVALWVAGQKVQGLALQGDRYRADWNLGGLPNGPVAVQIRVTDTAGQVSTWERTLNVQRAATGMREVGRFHLSGPPSSNVAVNPQGTWAFVAVGGSLHRIDTASGRTDTLALGEVAQSLLYQGGTLYATTGNDSLYRIRASDLQVLSQTSLGARVTAPLTAGPAGVFVGTQNALYRVDVPGAPQRLGGQRVDSLAVGQRVHILEAVHGNSLLTEVTVGTAGLSVTRSARVPLAWITAAPSGQLYGSGWSFGPLYVVNADLSLQALELGSFEGVVRAAVEVQGITVAGDRSGTLNTQSQRFNLPGNLTQAMWVQGPYLYAGDRSGAFTMFVAESGSLRQVAQRSGLGSLYGDLTGDAQGRVYFLSLAGQVIVYAPQ